MSLNLIKLAELKRDVMRGLVTSFEVRAVPNGWEVCCVGLRGTEKNILADAHKGQPRIFKTADAAIRAIRSAGVEAAGFTIHADELGNGHRPGDDLHGRH